MSRFQATRQVLNAVDASRSSASSLDPALSTLSPDDAEVLDSIIAKVPEATTFMTVFKAYSEVLQQRGLDPGNDVVYYKQLLKLGVIKGVDWGTKWNIVKNQLGFDLTNATPRRSERRILPSHLTGLPPHELEEDVFTLHSHADETETAVDPPRRGQPSRRPYDLEPSVTDPMESLNFSSEQSMSIPPLDTPRPVPQVPVSRTRFAPPSLDLSEIMGEAPTRSSTPPPSQFRKREIHSLTSKLRDVKGKGPEYPLTRIDDAEAWRKVDQERRLQDADRFRKETLLSAYFDNWKVGLDWIRTTHTQIIDARNHVQLRIYFEHWKGRTARLRHISERAAQVAYCRTQSTSFNFWKEKTHHKRVAEWKEEMRGRMVWVKHKRDERALDEAWTKWRQAYRSRQLYARNVLFRTFRRWREKFGRLATLESLADNFDDVRDRRTLEKIMETWTRRIQMHDAERCMVQMTTRRILTHTFEIWIRNAQDNHYADAHHTLRVLKKMFQAWQITRANKHLLELRGDKHLRRRDDVLLRAIIRVWVARERGQLLDRVKSARLMKDAFIVWLQRRQEQCRMDDRALAFSQHGSTLSLVSAFKTWSQRMRAQNSALVLADQHYTANFMYHSLLIWRLRLRMWLKLARRAKMARKYFIHRCAWDKWRLVLEEKRRERIYERLERDVLKKAFRRWLGIMRLRIHQERATKSIQKRTRKRVLRDVLQHWTNRVVSLKLREIDTVEQRERDMLSLAFTRWKDMCLRHVENLSLVNSFQDVKREDTLRRMFLKWLAAARKTRDRRLRLAEREHELRLEMMAAAWETWWDHFRDNKLRDMEYRVIIQNQTNLIYRAFVTWQSRSKSVPGIRFHATNLKTKVWDRWRHAMPRAVQARQARELDAKNVLSAAFQVWTEAHRSKIALKAIARARYLRLPSPGQRASGVTQSQDLPPLRPLLHRPLHSRLSDSKPDSEPEPSTSRASALAVPAPFTRRKGLSSLLASRPTSRVVNTEDLGLRSIPRPSSVGVTGEDRRERLWHELRGASVRDPPDIGRARSR